MSIYAEDVIAGTSYDLGEHHVTIDEILDFRRRWDPYDIDGDEFGHGHFGGPIASGLHSLAILQRLAVINGYSHWAIIAGRRICDVSFRAPVRPEMTLRGSMTIDKVDLCDERRALITVSKTLSSEGAVILTATPEFYMVRRRPHVDG